MLPLFDYISKSIFPTSDWFCLITSHNMLHDIFERCYIHQGGSVWVNKVIAAKKYVIYFVPNSHPLTRNPNIQEEKEWSLKDFGSFQWSIKMKTHGTQHSVPFTFMFFLEFCQWNLSMTMLSKSDPCLSLACSVCFVWIWNIIWKLSNIVVVGDSPFYHALYGINTTCYDLSNVQ